MFKCGNCDKIYKTHTRYLKHKYNCIEITDNTTKDEIIETDTGSVIEDDIVEDNIEDDIVEDNNYQNMDDDLQSVMTYRTDRTDRTDRDILQLKQTISKIKFDKNKYKFQFFELKTKFKKIQQNEDKLRQQLSLVSSERDDIREKLLSFNHDISSLHNDKNNYKTQLITMLSTVKDNERNEMKLKEHITSINDRKKELKEKLQHVYSEKKELKNQITTLTNKHDELNRKYLLVNNTVSELTNNNKLLSTRIQELTNDIKVHDLKTNKLSEMKDGIIKSKDIRIQEISSDFLRRINEYNTEIEKYKKEIQQMELQMVTINTRNQAKVDDGLKASLLMLKNKLDDTTNSYEGKLKNLQDVHDKNITELKTQMSDVLNTKITSHEHEKKQLVSNYETKLNELTNIVNEKETLYKKSLENYKTLEASKNDDVSKIKKELEDRFRSEYTNRLEKLKLNYDNDKKVIEDDIQTLNNKLKYSQNDYTHIKNLYTKNLEEHKNIQNELNTKLDITTKQYNDTLHELSTFKISQSKENSRIRTNYEVKLKEQSSEIDIQKNSIIKLTNENKELKSKIEELVKSHKDTGTVKDEQYQKSLTNIKNSVSLTLNDIEMKHQDVVISYKNKIKELENDKVQLLKLSQITKEEYTKENIKTKQTYEQHKKELDDTITNMKKELTRISTELINKRTEYLKALNNETTRKKELETTNELLNSRLLETQKALDVLQRQSISDKQHYNKQLDVLSKYKNDDEIGVTFLKEKLSETENERDKFKNMSKDVHQRLLLRANDLKKAKDRIYELEGMLENTIKKFNYS